MRRARQILLLGSALLPLLGTGAAAGPQGPSVVGGSATVHDPGSANVVVNQSSQRAVINWHMFNIGAGETTTFNTPGASAVTLNRVTGGMGPSQILGTLTSNGQVFIVNRDGFVFGANAVVNTAGFLATTHDIRNEDFMAGHYRFDIPGRPDASIVNLGTITAANGGFAALVAPGVRNAGTITATLGSVGLAASGNGFTLDLYGDRLITLGVNDQVASQVIDVATGQPLSALVGNSGTLSANGGRVELTAAAARQVVDQVINTSGVIEANTIGTKGGQIVLGAATASAKPAGAPKQTVRVAGTLSAAGKQAGQKGGRIVVTGEDIQVAGATIDASGAAGGGQVLIGGDTGGGQQVAALSHPGAQHESFAVPTATAVSVDAATTINASATASGSGGKVVLWSDGQLTFAGMIAAYGAGSGRGGFVETSAKTIDVKGSIAAGLDGLWLLDPDDLTVDAPLATTIMGTLNGGSDVVHMTTFGATDHNRDIIVDANITWTGNASLTFSAYRNIQINDDVSITHSGGTGNLNLRADNTGNGTGTIVFVQNTMGSRVDFANSSGKVNFYYNPTNYTNPTDFTPTGQGSGRGVLTHPSLPDQFTAYMLVNNQTDLSDIGNNLSGAYALGKSFAGSGTLLPIGLVGGPFTGIFDGQNHVVSNLTISANTSTDDKIGLFAEIGANGVVRNLGLANITVNANPAAFGTQYLGILAGLNSGNISHVSSSGAVSSSMGNVVAGGLVGQNSGMIANSQSAATVGLTAGGTAGGLVGRNQYGGTISASHATGNISASDLGGADIFAGGLVGDNYGEIEQSSYATGNVSGSGGDLSLGGLAGANDYYGVISNSYATGDVTADTTTFAYVGGLVGGNEGSITSSHAMGDASLVNSTIGVVGGLVGYNLGSVSASMLPDSYATGAVNALNGIGGGFVGWNVGNISGSRSEGVVTGGIGAMLGGFVGWNIAGTIQTSHSKSSVGGGTISGGFAALNTGNIDRSFATGAVSVYDSGIVGGFAAMNFADTGLGIGNISNAYATGAVSTGLGGFAAGLVALNFGTLEQTYAAGLVTGGAGSTLGGLVAINGFNLPVGFVPPSTPVSTTGTATNSYWDIGTTGQGTSQGGTGLTTQQLTAALPAGFAAPVWGINAGTSYPFLDGVSNPIPTPGSQAGHGHPDATVDPPPFVPPLVNDPQTPDQPQDVITIVSDTPPPPPPNGGNPPRRVSGVPPVGETRFIDNEVVLQLGGNVTPEQVAAVARELGLEVVTTENVGLLARTVYRFRITDGKSVAEVIRALEAKNIAAFAQPNYVYTLAQETSGQETASISHTHGDSDQYIVPKLRLTEIHSLARGTDVLVAVIDSAVDPNHPDLQGAIAERFNALEGEVKPHTHGTGMAGAIASQRRLLGVAPRARLLTVSAFGPKQQTAESTSMQIVKGLSWAVEKGARVINMSFAGPHDPMLQQAIKTMHGRGIIMVAAAGNAGPGSPPLFPAADPNVIAVTATDIQDRVFQRANRGKHISVAAPGVDILVPAPEGSYQLTTGTSVAAAHVSGIAALLLERNPGLKPAELRKLLTSTARRGSARPEDIGSGLVDPYQALQRAAPKSVRAN